MSERAALLLLNRAMEKYGLTRDEVRPLVAMKLNVLDPPVTLGDYPAWHPCTCDAFWCTVHFQHVADCPCPEIEAWTAIGLNPYEDPYPEEWRE